jgi:hypothetical protein
LCKKVHGFNPLDLSMVCYRGVLKIWPGVDLVEVRR